MEQRLISLREASQYSGIDQNYLRVLINRNILRGAKDRGDWFITETDLDDYLANHSRKKKKITFNKIAADVKPLEISADLQRLGNTRHKTFSPRGVLHSVTKENLVYFLNKEIEETLANQGIKWPETPGDLSIHRYVKLIPKVVVGTVILAGLGSFVLLAGLGDIQNLSRAVRGFPTLIGKYLAAADRNRIGPRAVPEAITDVIQKLDGLSTVILTRLDDDTYHFNRIFGQVFNYLGSGYSSGLVTLLDRYNAQPGADLVSGLFSNLQPLFAKFFIGSGLRETVTPAPGYFEFMAEVDKTRAVGVGETKVVVQSVVTPVRQIVERIETLVPGDVGELRLELTRVIQIEVNKLRAELASLEGSLTTTSRISDSSIRMVTLSQRIDELNAINIDNGATIRSGNLSVTSGSVTAPSATFTNLTVGSFSANSTSATSTISTGGFAVGTNQFVIQQTSGRVGIGTTSPSDTLALNGAMYFASVSVPSVTSNRLYNAGGDLYWAGSVVGGSTTGTWASDGTNVWRAGGNVGIGTTSPYAKLSVVGGTSGTVIAADSITGFSGNLLDLKVASTTKFVINQNGDFIASGNSTTTNATTTALAISSITSSLLKTNAAGSLIAAIAGTDYVAGSSFFAFPWTQTTYGNSTSTTLGFLEGFLSTASSTINSSFKLPTLSSGGLGVDATGLVYSGATTTAGTGLTYSGNQFNVDLGTAIDISTETNLTGGLGLTLTDDDLACDPASSSVFGCLASADWTTFNDKLSTYDAWTHPAYGGSATTSLLTLSGGFLNTAASSTIVGNLLITGNSTTTQATTTNFAVSSIASSLLKTSTGGSLLAAVSGTDYEPALTFSTGLSRSVNTITVDQAFSPPWTGAHIFDNITRSTTTSATC